MKLTPLRSSVLEEVAASHGAVGAYDLLDRLARRGQRLAPISIYRALDALVGAGVVHRLESRNAYYACHAAHTPSRPCLVLVCRGCGTVAETPARPVWDAIGASAEAVSFSVEGSLIEVDGICGPCRRVSGEAASA